MNLRKIFKKGSTGKSEHVTTGEDMGMIRELKKLEAYRKEFLGNVSHELKTPLFNIQGYVLTLLEGGIDDPLINRNYLEKTSKNIDRMISIIEDLEVISQLESGEMSLNLTRFNIYELAAEIIDLHEVRAKQKNIRLEAQKSPFIVHADKDRVRTLLSNLVDNSIKYGIRDGKTSISFSAWGDKVITGVSDNGIGIHRKEIPRIFERFYRVDKSRSREQGGSGLGLSIAKHIIEAHGEKIWAESKFGSGTAFYFSLSRSIS